MTRCIILDTETTGLNVGAEVWEIAAYPWEPGLPGLDQIETFQVRHDLAVARASLPPRFLADYETRYDHSAALLRSEAAERLRALFVPDEDGTKPLLVGAVPSFDDRMLRRLPRIGDNIPWHYHLQCVESHAVGYLTALSRTVLAYYDQLRALRKILRPPYDSEALSLALGVTPPGEGERHTAAGDTTWAAQMWDRIHNPNAGHPEALTEHWVRAAESLR